MQPAACSSHAGLVANIGAKKAGSFEEFCWALAAVRSRSICIGPKAFPKVVVKGSLVLIPYVDFFNHDPDLVPDVDTQPVRESKDGSNVEILAFRDYAEGSEVFISYGLKSSADLLLGYGFVPAKNPYDAVELDIEVACSASDAIRVGLCKAVLAGPSGNPFKKQCELLNDPTKNRGALRVRVRLTVEHPLPAALLSLTRLDKLSPEGMSVLFSYLGGEFARRIQFGEAMGKPHGELPEGHPLYRAGLWADFTAVQGLQKLLKARFAAFATTLEKDEKLLAEDGLKGKSGNVRMALTVRMEEKRILRAAIEAIGPEVDTAQSRMQRCHGASEGYPVPA